MRNLFQEFGLWFLLVPISFYFYNRNRNKKLSQIMNSESSPASLKYVGKEFGNPFFVPYLFLSFPIFGYYFFTLGKNLDVQTSLIVSFVCAPFCFLLASINGKKYLITSGSLVVIPFVGQSIKIGWDEITNVNLRVVPMRSGGTGWIMDLYSLQFEKGLSTIKSDTKDSEHMFLRADFPFSTQARGKLLKKDESLLKAHAKLIAYAILAFLMTSSLTAQI